MPRGRGRGRGKHPSRQEPVPEPQAQHVSTDDTSSIASSTLEIEVLDDEAAQPKKKCRPKKTTDLSPAEEEDMAEWLMGNTIFYNKKLACYKNKERKEFLWAEKAREMDRSVDILQIWYRSIRTRYTRLLKKKSGEEAPEFTERDQWILTKMDFLRGHIYAVRKRPLVSVSIMKKISVIST